MKRGISAPSNRWWNREMKERRITVGREMRRGRSSEAAVRAKAELQKSIRLSNCRM